MASRKIIPSQYVCEMSLRWVLSMRYGMTTIPGFYSKNEPQQKFLLKVFTDRDNHTAESFEWTLRQCKQVEYMGLDEWLSTHHARGFRVVGRSGSWGRGDGVEGIQRV